MSRDVDLDNLSEEDKLYLAQRGQLSTDVMSLADQKSLLDPEQLSLEQRANTGTVNTAGLTTEELEAELERRREEAEAVDPRKLFTKEGLAGASADEEDALEPPYDDYVKAQLSAEIQRRNEANPDADPMPLSGTHPALVARLEEDDEG